MNLDIMKERYESLPVVELRAVAKARGMRGISALRKEDLIIRMLEEDKKEANQEEQEKTETAAARNGTDQRQEEKKEDKKKAEPTESVPFYQGTSIGVEIAGLGSYLLGSDILNTEIAVQANLKNRFLPVIEVGYGKADAINDGNNLHYKTSVSEWIIMCFTKRHISRVICMWVFATA